MIIVLAAVVVAGSGFYLSSWITDIADRIRLNSAHCQDTSDQTCMYLSFAVSAGLLIANGLVLLFLGAMLRHYIGFWPAFASATYVLIGINAPLLIHAVGAWAVFSPHGTLWMAVACGVGYGTALLLDWNRRQTKSGGA